MFHLYKTKKGTDPTHNIPFDLTEEQIDKIRQDIDDSIVIPLDEYTLMGTIWIEHINVTLQRVKWNTKNFGGIIIIFTGDPLQLHPIIPPGPIHETVIKNVILNKGKNIHEISKPKHLGMILFLKAKRLQLKSAIRYEHDIISEIQNWNILSIIIY